LTISLVFFMHKKQRRTSGWAIDLDDSRQLIADVVMSACYVGHRVSGVFMHVSINLNYEMKAKWRVRHDGYTLVYC
jgi:hypothetical protein